MGIFLKQHGPGFGVSVLIESMATISVEYLSWGLQIVARSLKAHVCGLEVPIDAVESFWYVVH